MKDRLKKYYNDHEDIIIAVGVRVAIFSACAFTISKIIEGQGVDRVSRLINDDNTMDVRIIQKNGKQSFWHWETMENK